MNIILIILVFGVIIFFHELGHFVVAKLNHILVAEFSIGFGPKLFSFHKKETQYTLRLIPLGGYCMYTDDEESEEDNGDEASYKEKKEEESETEDGKGKERVTLNQKSVWVRMAVILAGPAMNFILAFLFSMVIIHFCGSDPAQIGIVYNEASIEENFEEDEIADIKKEFNGVYPADEADIRSGDTVLKIEGSTVKNFRELQIYLEIYGDGSPINLTMQREDGTIYDTTVYPTKISSGYKIGIQSVGYQLPGSFLELCEYSAYETRYWVKATFLSLKLILTRQVSSEEISGPVGVAKSMNDTFNEAAKYSKLDLLLNWLNYIVLLSANLGVMNLLPIPGLDGGRFLFLLIEAVTRKRVPKEKENIVTLIGFVIVMALMIVILFNDIKNVFFLGR